MSERSFYIRLQEETRPERAEFSAIPLIKRALAGDVTIDLYLRYLAEAYHHVRHTCPLMGAALSRCGPKDYRYRDALLDYIQEEQGHEKWILNDIAALGGDAAAVEAGDGGPATRIMVACAYNAIDRGNPYSLLGMVHVLEGMSVDFATQAAEGIAMAAVKAGFPVSVENNRGFSYLSSHGSLDQDHVLFFKNLVNALPSKTEELAVIDSAKLMYRLFGDIFRDLDVETLCYELA